ncbi:MAG: hypothetical protein NTV22_10595 [bacterium]|nr:hypothetical protein [bacterium]
MVGAQARNLFEQAMSRKTVQKIGHGFAFHKDHAGNNVICARKPLNGKRHMQCGKCVTDTTALFPIIDVDHENKNGSTNHFPS